MMFGYGFDNTFGYLGWLGMFLMMLIPLAIIVGIIYLVYKAMDKGTDRVHLGGEVHDPLSILKARYAKGEISQEEFEQVRQDLIREKNAG